jgi:hypothetical protein
MEENQNKWKKDILPTEKLIICKILFCGLATRTVNIVIEMPVVENNIHYWAVSVTEEHLKRRTFEINLGQWDIILKNGTKENPTLNIF